MNSAQVKFSIIAVVNVSDVKILGYDDSFIISKQIRFHSAILLFQRYSRTVNSFTRFIVGLTSWGTHNMISKTNSNRFFILHFFTSIVYNTCAVLRRRSFVRSGDTGRLPLVSFCKANNLIKLQRKRINFYRFGNISGKLHLVYDLLPPLPRVPRVDALNENFNDSHQTDI